MSGGKLLFTSLMSPLYDLYDSGVQGGRGGGVGLRLVDVRIVTIFVCSMLPARGCEGGGMVCFACVPIAIIACFMEAEGGWRRTSNNLIIIVHH